MSMAGNAQITDSGKTLFCLSCGIREALTLPMALDAFGKALKAFGDEHDKCPPVPAPES